MNKTFSNIFYFSVKGASARSPKLFFVSSKSTTSTVSTTTLCYTSIANAAVVSCGRKKRAIMDEVLGFVDKTPVAIEADAPHETVEDIISGMDEASAERLVDMKELKSVTY